MVAVLVVATLVIRLPNFGDPTYHLDEAFYLFVGQRMGEGMLPYADIWDRKPVGVFALYAAIAKLGGVYAYQGLAAVFACATSIFVARIARLYASRAAACLAGVFYLAMAGALAGGGGQSPIFYNAFVAAAAWLVARDAANGPPRGAGRAGDAAMILCGLALTFKPTALPEGIFLGTTLLAMEWRAGTDLARLARRGARWCLIAAAPTVFAWLYFAGVGHFAEYWFATVESVFLTLPADAPARSVRVAWLTNILWLPLCLAVAGLAVTQARAGSDPSRPRYIAPFLTGWLVAAMLGFLLVPNYYDHYALPLAVVLAAASARLFEGRLTGPVLSALAIAHTLALSGYPVVQAQRKSAAQLGFASASALIERNRDGRCLFVFDATPALYRIAPACRGSKYLFPEHLSNAREAPAIGADPSAELRAILRQRPGVVAMAQLPSLATPNVETRRLLESHLERNYRLVGTAVLTDVVHRHAIAIYALRAGR